MLNWPRKEGLPLSFLRQLLFFLILGFFVGVVVSINQFVFGWLIYLFAGWGVVGLFLAWRYQVSRFWLLIFSVFCLGLVLGQWRAMPRENWGANICSDLGHNFSGLVVAEPVAGEFNQRLVVRPAGKNFNVLLFAKRDGDWRYGDEINFQGSLQEPKNFQTDTGQEFAYKNYLLKDNILCLGRGGQVTWLSGGHGSNTKRVLFTVKKEFLNTINRYLPAPQSSLLSGILLGVQSSLPQTVSDDYRRAGLTHILVLSGQNISIIASALMIIFGWAGPLISFVIVVTGLVLFTLMAGAGASVVRAAVMGLLVVLARAVGRPYAGGLALVTAGALMVWFNPRLLVFDLGFQLSFLATLGLFYGTPMMARLLKFLPATWGLREITSISAGAILFTSPWLAYSFGQLSLVALPANILVVPTVEMTMLFGFLTVVFGWLQIPFAWPLAFISSLLLKWNLFITSFFAHLPGASIVIKNVSLVFVIFFYLIILGAVLHDKKLSQKKST
ncbi:MAG: ComEC/Rec2 family competence protein [Candidatus Paceibacterota bacterium]|jgi:competence protein ComEC